jgi:hypothetical protein
LFVDNFRWNEYCTEHNLGWPLSILHDQHRTNSKNFEVSRGIDKFSFSTSETISEMGSTLGDRISSNSICDQCDVEVRATEDHQLFVRGDANRPHRTQRRFSDASTGLRPSVPASLPTRQERGCDPENRGLVLWELCREQPVGSSKQNLPIRLHSISTKDQKDKPPCENCLAILKHNTPKMSPHFLIY